MPFTIPWGKLHRTHIIQDYHIRFDTRMKCAEDACFNKEYFCYVRGIALIPYTDYFYYSLNNCMKYGANGRDCAYDALETIRKYEQLTAIHAFGYQHAIRAIMMIHSGRFYAYQVKKAFSLSGFKEFKTTYLALSPYLPMLQNSGGRVNKIYNTLVFCTGFCLCPYVGNCPNDIQNKKIIFMRPLHILMPMAGEGSRFLKEGWTMPKPLIRLNDKELFLRAISSVGISGVEMKYSFIVRQEHIDKYAIDKGIKKILHHANVFAVQKTTRGAVETCLIAREAIAAEDSVLVMDCDLEFRSQGFNALLKEILSQPVDAVNGGVLVSFDSDEPRYSYAEINDEGVVIRTAEKEVISNHALCGAYFFSSAKSFFFAADSLMCEANFSKPEYYVSLLYNYLLQRGETVRLAKMEEYYS